MYIRSLKKAVICAAKTKERLQKEITEMGMALVMGGVTDGFGAAKKELQAFLNLADECANYLLFQNQEQHLIIESKICSSQKCNYYGRFRYKRRIPCLMHNLDRILEPLL